MIALGAFKDRRKPQPLRSAEAQPAGGIYEHQIRRASATSDAVRMETCRMSLVSEARCGGWPRIAFVTPVRNSAKFIEATIQSVLAQEYPNLDYFIVDGGSNDGTVEIIRKYENKISGWISEPDRGMYDAINKAFRRTTGEIMGWISATDILYPGGLRVVGSVFNDLPEIEWITGRPALINEQ